MIYWLFFSCTTQNSAVCWRSVPRAFELPGNWSVVTSSATPGTFFPAGAPC